LRTCQPARRRGEAALWLSPLRYSYGLGRDDAPHPAEEEDAMPVDPELLAILACPECKTPVVPVKDGAALKCEKCKRVYPVRDDIPVMLLDEATVEP
jgi:uncharacterized protein